MTLPEPIVIDGVEVAAGEVREWFSPKETTKELSCLPAGKVLDMIRSGEIASSLIGGEQVVSRATIERVLDELPIPEARRFTEVVYGDGRRRLPGAREFEPLHWYPDQRKDVHHEEADESESGRGA